MNWKFLLLLPAMLLVPAPAAFSRSVEVPPKETAPVKKDKGQRYLESAERLKTEAGKLEKRIAKLPVEQQQAALDLVAAKRELAATKTEAAELWVKHLGELPQEFKPKLKQAQSKHSALSKEFYRIGRELKLAGKASSTSTNLIAPASIFGK
jgi:hypothetical protein